MADHTVSKSELLGHERRAEVVAGLRELADFIEQHDVPMHRYAIPRVELYSSWLGDDPVANSPRRMAKAMGKVEKHASEFSDFFELRRTFSGGVAYVFSFERKAICKATVVGQKDETEERFEFDGDLLTLEQLRDLHSKQVVTGTRDVVEYDCSPLLGQSQ